MKQLQFAWFNREERRVEGGTRGEERGRLSSPNHVSSTDNYFGDTGSLDRGEQKASRPPCVRTARTVRAALTYNFTPGCSAVLAPLDFSVRKP
ncbi:hypothetical protein F7725_027933 [Dissostichus mawsoni]|uniref:Uncharacterized protein n=1 Tax=Dissostichus mawsoni TaxID=36200 RepID=A0A7J5XEA0_DISMA|nr:hypothetical protein F7725_027933 [Dissostichus mawsoni]